MDWLTFISSVIHYVAWPATLLIIVVLLRKPIRDLIPLLKRLKWKELELEFTEKLVEAKTLAAEVLPPHPKDPPLHKTPTSPPYKSARNAIIESWSIVESAAFNAISKLSPGHVFPLSALDLRDALNRLGILNAKEMELYDSMLGLRNKLVHDADFEIDFASANQYSNIAGGLAERLRSSGVRLG